MLFDKEREDGIFTPREPSAVIPNPFTNGAESNGSQGDVWNPLDSIYVTMPPWHPASIASPLIGTKDKIPKNPVSHWRVSKKSVVDFVFSPDVKCVGAISEDGCLRIIDALAEQ